MELKKLIKLQNAVIKAHQRIKAVESNSDNQTKELQSEINGLTNTLEQLTNELNGFTKKEVADKQNIELERLRIALDELNTSLEGKISSIQLKHGRDGLNGKDGKDGMNGKDGKDGKNGKDGLNGKDGKDGLNGLSAYEIAKKQGFKGTEKEWIEHITNNGGKNYSGQIAAIRGKLNEIEGKLAPEDVLTQASILQTIEECEQCQGEQVPAASLMAMTYNAIPRMVSEVENDAGYITEETDPVFTNSVAYSITANDINKWNNIDTKVNMFHAAIDNSNFQYVKGSADFTYEDVVNTENCVIEVQVANEKVYMVKQEFKNINPPDPIAGRYVGFSQMIRVANENAELFLFVYDPENLPTDEESLKRLEDWGDYQYCVSSYQPVVMGNFLVKDIATNRAVDNNAPSSKATGDYVDSQCGVVLDYMQTTFAQNIMALAGLTFTKKPDIIYDNPTGFEATNDGADETYQLTGLDLSKYKRLKFYVAAYGTSNDNFSPSHIVEMHLDDRAKTYKDVFVAGHASQNPNNRNRLHMVTFAVNAEKTAVQFCHSTSLYGTAATDSSGSRTCYLIEGYYD